MTVYESDLPGVGKKHEIDLGDGARLIVVTHNTGKREVFRRPDADVDAENCSSWATTSRGPSGRCWRGRTSSRSGAPAWGRCWAATR